MFCKCSSMPRQSDHNNFTKTKLCMSHTANFIMNVPHECIYSAASLTTGNAKKKRKKKESVNINGKKVTPTKCNKNQENRQ